MLDRTDSASAQLHSNGAKVALMKSRLRRLIRQARGLLRPFPKVDADAFKGFKNPLMQQVAKTNFYRHRGHEIIRGWMTPGERQILYSVARHMPGPITEIGAWTPENFRPIDGKIGMFLPDCKLRSALALSRHIILEYYLFWRAPAGKLGCF
jgi:hypothetical protein